MNDLQTLENQPTMSSREIAELTNKEHKNVMRDIRELMDSLIKAGRMNQIDRLSFEHIYPDTYGRMQTEYRLPRLLCYTLITGYSAELRDKIVNRWDELENQIKQPKMMTHLETARALVSALEKIESQKPAVQFVERYVEASSTKGIREVGKLLGIKQNEFVQKLLSAGILYRDSKGSLQPYAEYVGEYFKVNTTTKNGITIFQTKFQPAGIVWIAEKFGITAAE